MIVGNKKWVTVRDEVGNNEGSCDKLCFIDGPNDAEKDMGIALYLQKKPRSS